MCVCVKILLFCVDRQCFERLSTLEYGSGVFVLCVGRQLVLNQRERVSVTLCMVGEAREAQSAPVLRLSTWDYTTSRRVNVGRQCVLNQRERISVTLCMVGDALEAQLSLVLRFSTWDYTPGHLSECEAR